MTPTLDGRTALVTGAGSGIGAACAVALSEAGAKVHVVDRDSVGAARVADEVGGIAHVVDLSIGAAIDELPAEIDILVNNAGLQHTAPVHQFPPAMFTLMQQVMVTAPFLLAARCLPYMYSRGWGRIVNVSSAHGLRASVHKSAYVAAKHGLEGLSKVIALEAAPHGVTSNCVNPGFVRTPLVDSQLAVVGEAELLHRSAVKRLIEPDEVAALVTWLCGDAARSLSGASLPIDGAWTAS